MNVIALLMLLIICVSVVTAQRAPTVDPARLRTQVTIYRDTYGVPHVFGRTDAATIFGFAYAQAEDNFGGWRNAGLIDLFQTRWLDA